MLIKKKDINEILINEILTAVYRDYVILRNYLIEYGFIDRKADGSQYWLTMNK
ncbi:DUF2087 domain-containing protein [Rummeliibacillus pycnus]|uniref:DUF2087 domain-containing protein n=1 Tax=Rummeliibacillus pycnus TaxID=101070 RepID=UPI0037C6CEE9